MRIAPTYFEKKVKISMAHKWKEIGRELGVPAHVLESIVLVYQAHHPKTIRTNQYCFIKMLKWWKENNPTATNLEQFVKALHLVGEHDAEKEVKEIHAHGENCFVLHKFVKLLNWQQLASLSLFERL